MKTNIKKIKKYIGFKNTALVVKKELKAYFNSPFAYIALIIFLLLWEFLFFRNAFLTSTASLRMLFGLLPWLLMFLCPAITMGSISQEKSDGTLELLLTHSLKNAEIILGKFLAALAFVVIAILLTIPVGISFSVFGDLDIGTVFTQYLAAFSLAGLFISLGILISSFFRSQISSLLVGIVSNFILLILGSEIITISLPFSVASFFEKISSASHFFSMIRGVVDLRDIWYFFSIITLFLSLALLLLLRYRYGKGGFRLHKYKILMTVFLVVVILTNLLGNRIPGRLDLTQEGLYTLSKSTKQIISDLNETATITVFSSGLPPQFQSELRDVKNILQDYKTLGRGNVVILYKDPLKNNEAAQEAATAGIQEMQFNVIAKEEFKTKKGFFGLQVSLNNGAEVIPFIESTRSLEYQLTSFIKKLSSNEKKTIAFLTGHGEKSPSLGLSVLGAELENQFNIVETTGETLPTSTDVLVIAGPTENINENIRENIKHYIENSGPALFLIDTISVNPQGLAVETNENNFADFLLDYGVKIQNDIIYDTQSKETVRFGGGLISFFLPYPFWPVLETKDETSPLSVKIKTLVLPWASSININQDKLNEIGLKSTILFATTKSGGAQKDNFNLTPEQSFPSVGLDILNAIVSVEKEKTETSKEQRIIIVGDSDFLSDGLIQDMPANLAFGIDAISFLAQESSLAGIQLKQRAQPKLQFENQSQITKVKYGNIAFVSLMPVGFGLFKLLKRKRLKKYTYSSRN